MNPWFVLALAALVAGCVPVERNPARDVVGVSAAGNQATTVVHDAAAQKLLAWKAGEICTVPGYDVERQTVVPAEDNHRIINWQLRCRPYTAMTPVRF